MSIDEAMQLLEPDPNTGKYQHRFMPVWKSKLVTPICAICNDSKNKHYANSQFLMNQVICTSSEYSSSDQMEQSQKCLVCWETVVKRKFI